MASEQGTFWDGVRTTPYKRGLTERQKAGLRRYRAKDPEKHRERARRWVAEHPERHRQTKREEYARNPEKFREIGRQRYANNPEPFLQRSRRAKGIRDATGERRIGTCPLCLKANCKLVCDHNHDTGATRDWLCNRCNTRYVGVVEELKKNGLLQAVQAYLARHG